jgi:prepilin-type N-terminal cleavage/methylation domain-containing protein
MEDHHILLEIERVTFTTAARTTAARCRKVGDPVRKLATTNQFGLSPALRSAFTIVEVLVVLFIIGVLLALMIPAVQQARTSASQLECKNRLRQIGLALHEFESTHKQFPGLADYRHSWLVALLPYLDQSALYEQFDLNLAWSDEPNLSLGQLSIEAFCCPADPSRRSGCVNYIGNGGSGNKILNGTISAPAARAGDFTAGLSNTAAVSECRGGIDDQPFEFISGSASTRDEWLQFVDECRQSGDQKWPTRNMIGVGWTEPGLMPCGYVHVLLPAGNSCKLHSESGRGSLFHSVITPRSYHTAGVNLVLADGSVRFVSQSIDQGEWRQLGSRDDFSF